MRVVYIFYSHLQNITVAFAGIVRHRLEGIMAKRIDSPYLIGKRSSDWLKIKVAHTADFEVIGCVPTRGENAVRALLLGERVQGRLVYKGKVSMVRVRCCVHCSRGTSPHFQRPKENLNPPCFSCTIWMR